MGEHVALRPHSAETLPALKRWYADPELVRLARHRNEPLTGDEVERLVRERFTTAQMLAFALYERIGPAEQLIGSCTLANLDIENGAASFHLMIGEPAARGRGLGSEATRLVTQFAFEALGLHRISHDSQVPGWSGTRGDLVFNTSPGADRVFAWVCLGAHRWQTLKSAE